MKNWKRIILLIVVGVLILSTLALSACSGGEEGEVQTVDVKIEEITKNGEIVGCVVAYGKASPSAKNYGFKVIYSNGIENFFQSTNIAQDGAFSARIEGLAEGTYSIRAYVGDEASRKFGEAKTFDALTDRVDSIKIMREGDKETKALSPYEGQNYTLYASVLPLNTKYVHVTWTSSDESVVKVENGVITCVSAGVAYVRASVSSDFVAECKVTVKQKIEVDFAVSEYTMFVGENYTIKATISPEGADGNLTWTSSDEKIVTVDNNGKVTAKKLGSTSVYATTVSGDKAYCTIVVAGEFSINLDKTLKIMEQGDELSLTATVNPSSALSRGLTWYADKEGIVEIVSDGVDARVTAIGKGTTFVCADINGVIAKCEVTVKDDYKVEFYIDNELYATRYTGSSQNYKVRMPEDPADHGTHNVPYYFEGWYLDAGFKTPVNDNTTFNADTTVYGKTNSLFTYSIYAGKAYITGLKATTTEVDLVIPDQIGGTPIEGIYYGAFQGSSLQAVYIEKGIKTILDDAFRDCADLDTVVFEADSTLKKIGDSAFRDCVALSEIKLPFSVNKTSDGTVGELCFYGAPNAGYFEQGADQKTKYGEMYSYNLQKKQYYSNKYVYEFMGDDTMFIGGYIEPSVGYFANYVTLESVIKDWVDSGTNTIIGIGQARYGTTSTHYKQMFEYLEQYGGMMLMKNSIGSFQSADDPSAADRVAGTIASYADQYASFAGYHIEDEPGVSSWVPGLGEYSVYQPNDGIIPSHMQYTHQIWGKYLTRKLYYVNLLPVNSPIKAFAWGADNYAYGPNVDKLWSSYEQYANYDYYYQTYIKYVKPEIFSYDFYPLWANGGPGYLTYPTLNARHFEQLYKTHYYTTEYAEQEIGRTIPFWNFVQITSWGTSWGGGSREATYREVMWQINTAFAFGSKGYQYFVFTDYGDISGQGNPSNYGNCPMNIDGSKGPAYDDVVEANKHSQGMAKWLLNADVDHIYQSGANPNSEIIDAYMFTPKSSYDWAFESSSGVPNLVSHMTYYANNNEYIEGVAGDTRELYFVCNNGTQSKDDGEITVNFEKSVSGSYIYGGVEKTFSGKTLTVNTKAGEGFAILLNK
ncbi:MAG: Ig-like domain-containing protein [Clostridia bacterium]|nr:Ig-like domain-containing protein [Clostridia bacterium]